MDRPGDNGSIRLTNKTALALRKSARQERTLALFTAIFLTALLAALAVLVGIRWLFAVPLFIALAVMIDAVIAVRAGSRYQMLTGQAICAEAAARQMRVDRREKDRRMQARRDFDDVKADVMSAALMAQAATQETQEEPQGDVRPSGLSSGAKRETRPEEMQNEQESAEDEESDDGHQQDGLSRVPVRRRRRQASLTVLRSEDVK